MCQGILYTQTRCGHARKFEAIPGGDCLQYNNQPRGHCDGQIVIIHKNQIASPSLCVRCFRKAEDEIYAATAEKIDSVAYEIEELEAVLRGKEVRETRLWLERRLQASTDDLGEYRRERREAIANSRAMEGVWADG